MREGESDPRCQVCGGILKSATISFGQALDPAALERAEMASLSCDLFLAVGSTLAVHPAAGFADVARNNGAALVVVNAEPTAYDRVADAVVRGSIGELLPALLAP